MPGTRKAKEEGMREREKKKQDCLTFYTLTRYANAPQ